MACRLVAYISNADLLLILPSPSDAVNVTKDDAQDDEVNQKMEFSHLPERPKPRRLLP